MPASSPKKIKTVGSRAEVFHGNAKRTSGRLTKADLMKNKAGRIVSRQKHDAGKAALKYLHAKGYIAVKGKFGSARKAAAAPEPVAAPEPDGYVLQSCICDGVPCSGCPLHGDEAGVECPYADLPASKVTLADDANVGGAVATDVATTVDAAAPVDIAA
jgi:hypothetical protein